MAITQISRIQHRRGLRVDLPSALHDAEFGWADNTRELFIGNGPLAPVGGNTQILTQISPASLPKYSYISNTGAAAVTGFDHAPLDPYVPDANFPTIRSYQEKFDDYVSVLDYGAVGDGSDDTAAIRRANFDIYDETASPVAALRKFRVLYFPAGTYVVTRELYLYPNTVWLGDGAGRTKIILANGGTRTGFEDDCVVRTVDSLGQIGAAIDGAAVYAPENIKVSGISFESETSNTSGYTLGQIDVVKLEDAKNVRFENCSFTGTWALGFADFSRAIHIDNPGATAAPVGDYTFSNCLFASSAYGFNPTVDLTNVYIVDSKFDTNDWGIKLGDAGSPSISLFRASHSIFENIGESGFDDQSAGIGNMSTYNHYRGVHVPATIYAIASVRFAVSTSGCVSLGDTFDTTTAFDCADVLINTRAQNHSSTNIVMNAQDAFQIPNGFCGSIVISGDLTVEGCIVSGKTPVTVVDDTTVIASVPYTPATGSAIFFDFVMQVSSESVYRVGTLHVIHDGSGTNVVGVNITYSETYTEIGGAPSESIALEAEFNAGNIEVTVIDPLGAALLPTFNFLTRCIDL